MQTRQLSTLGPDIYKYIKEGKKKEGHRLYKVTLAHIAKQVLGIGYNNLKLRLEDNNLKLNEVEKLCQFFNWDLELKIDKKRYVVSSIPLTPTLQEQYEARLKDKDEIINLLKMQLANHKKSSQNGHSQ